jgi:hypothetical protein
VVAARGTRGDVQFDAAIADIDPDELLHLSVQWQEWDNDVWAFAFNLLGRPEQEGAPNGRGLWEADWHLSEREVRSLVEFLTFALERLP